MQGIFPDSDSFQSKQKTSKSDFLSTALDPMFSQVSCFVLNNGNLFTIVFVLSGRTRSDVGRGLASHKCLLLIADFKYYWPS